MGITLFVCGRRSSRPTCSDCKAAPAGTLCDYPLAGRVAGTTCSKDLCSRCARAWLLTYPVQLSSEYRQEHGADLCRVHHELVLDGRGPGLFEFMAALRKKPAGEHLASRLTAASLAERPAMLIKAAADASLFLSRPVVRPKAVEQRVAILAQSALLLAKATNAPDPTVRHQAEAQARELVASLREP